MTDDGHHGEGEHDERDMPVPAMPGAGFVVIEAKFVLGRFEAVFDGPTMAFDRSRRCRANAEINCSCRWTECDDWCRHQGERDERNFDIASL